MSRYADFVLAVAGELSAVAEREVDPSIERALGRLGELVGADRAYVFLRDDDGQAVSNTHEWCSPGTQPAREQLQHLALGTFPWAFSLLDELPELAVPRVADSPPGPERTEWEREQIRTLFCAPLTVHGRVSGFVGCDWVRREDLLDDDTRLAVRVAASLIAGAVSRRRAWLQLEYRARLEELVLRISSRFINLRADGLGLATAEALEAIGRFIGVEAGGLAHFGGEGRVDLPHLWRVPPLLAPQPETWSGLEPGLMQRWLELLREGKPLAVPSVTGAKELAPPVQAALEAHRVGALLCVPISVGGLLWGVLGFCAARQPRAWTEDETTLLQLAAQVFGNALARADADLNEARLQAQLRQTQKLEVVGQLAGGVAHDFNNLLLSITLWSEIARRHLKDGPAEAREAIEEIRRSSDRAATLTQQLLTFSRHHPARVETVDLDQLVTEMLKMLRRLVRESIEIDFTPGNGSAVAGDPAQLEQVLLNLCVNASDAMPEGGRLSLSTRTAQLDARADAPAWVKPGPHVVLTVRDTGAGIAPDIRERVFEPFFTTKPPGSGTGLGLSTVYGIVRQHHGWVRVDSAPGRGSTFEVWLPEGAPAAPQPEPPSVPETERGSETVLIAEDDALVRGAMREVLTNAGYKVLVAHDGPSAVALFKQHGADLAVIDAVMPGLSGLETWRALEQLSPRLPVLFTSGYSSSVFPPHFFDDGRFELLSKPYPTALLLTRVRQRLAARQQTA